MLAESRAHCPSDVHVPYITNMVKNSLLAGRSPQRFVSRLRVQRYSFLWSLQKDKALIIKEIRG